MLVVMVKMEKISAQDVIRVDYYMVAMAPMVLEWDRL
jgi:hypothetical protein